jgi:Tol biopolymer transport system component
VLRAKDAGIDNVSQPRWSPDGRLLAFQGVTPDRSRKLYVYRPDNAKPEPLSGSEEGLEAWCWSPDSKWISFFSDETVKTRPEGVLWEMDVEEALAKLAK